MDGMVMGLVRDVYFFFFFFKQKTAYEIGTGDWSSDVCSSDLLTRFSPHDVHLYLSSILGSL